MTLTEFFEQGYFYFAINIIGFALVFGMFLSTQIKTRKISSLQIIIATIIFCVTILRPVCSFVFNYELKIIIAGKELNYDLYASALCYVLLFISHIIYYLDTKDVFTHKMLYRLAPERLGKKVYAYFDKEGRVISYTEAFFEELNIPLKKDYKWFKEVLSFEINGMKCDYQGFIEFIKESEDTTFKVSLQADIEEVTFNMEKWTVDTEEEVLGFILTSPEQKNTGEVKDGFYELIGQVGTPCAYYNDDARGISFKINVAFQNLVGIKGTLLEYTELRNHVFADDLGVFEASVNNVLSSQTYKYRLQTNEGIKMFEEVKVISNQKASVFLSLCEEVVLKIAEKKEFLTYVDRLIKDNLDYGVCIIALNSVNALHNELGMDVTKELLGKYLSIISKEVLRANDVLYRISDMEYCILFSDILFFDSVVRDISKDASSLLRYSITYNGKQYNLENQIGIVYSNPIIDSGTNLMKALDEALSFTNKQGYEKKYSIYVPTVKNQKMKYNKDEYRFEDYKIDLDNSFLNDER